jgi:hypothetical protein
MFHIASAYPQVDELDYIRFLVAAQKAFSAVEASKVHHR